MLVFLETSLPLAVKIDRTLLKRMQIVTRASHAYEQHAPHPPQHDFGYSSTSSDPYASILNQMSLLSLGHY